MTKEHADKKFMLKNINVNVTKDLPEVKTPE